MRGFEPRSAGSQPAALANCATSAWTDEWFLFKINERNKNRSFTCMYTNTTDWWTWPHWSGVWSRYCKASTCVLLFLAFAFNLNKVQQNLYLSDQLYFLLNPTVVFGSSQPVNWQNYKPPTDVCNSASLHCLRSHTKRGAFFSTLVQSIFYAAIRSTATRNPTNHNPIDCLAGPNSPREGLEPSTWRLTAARSTIELSRN